MQEVFEKIIDKLEKEIFSAELYGDEWDGQTVDNLLCLGNARDVIEQVATEYNNGWIPCSERLPEEAGTYIINALTGERNIVTFAKWQNRYKRFDMTGARAYWKIIAWCPLPEPYQSEVEG